MSGIVQARALRNVRTAARAPETPQRADETDVSVKTAQQYLDPLGEGAGPRNIERGDRTPYRIDRSVATHREVATLQRERAREELTAALESM